MASSVRWFAFKKWWCSTAILNYSRVWGCTWSKNCDLESAGYFTMPVDKGYETGIIGNGHCLRMGLRFWMWVFAGAAREIGWCGPSFWWRFQQANPEVLWSVPYTRWILDILGWLFLSGRVMAKSGLFLWLPMVATFQSIPTGRKCQLRFRITSVICGGPGSAGTAYCVRCMPYDTLMPIAMLWMNNNL